LLDARLDDCWPNFPFFWKKRWRGDAEATPVSVRVRRRWRRSLLLGFRLLRERADMFSTKEVDARLARRAGAAFRKQDLSHGACCMLCGRENGDGLEGLHAWRLSVMLRCAGMGANPTLLLTRLGVRAGRSFPGSGSTDWASSFREGVGEGVVHRRLRGDGYDSTLWHPARVLRFSWSLGAECLPRGPRNICRERGPLGRGLSCASGMKGA
jgi:hypothetical protein